MLGENLKMHSQSIYHFRFLLAVIGLCLSLTFPACNLPFAEKKLKLTPVSGKVTLDGEPVAGAKVVFLPRKLFVEQALPHPPSAAITDEQGVYHLQTDKTDGAPPGEYLVLVSKRDDKSALEEPDLSIIELTRGTEELNRETPAESWMSAETIPSFFNWRTSLRFTVPPQGTTEADFQLSIADMPLDSGSR